MKKVYLVLMLVVITLFITSCGQNIGAGESPSDVSAALKEVQSGTQGVEIEILPNFPPDLIYDSSELIALVEVKNRGNYDLDPQECFIHITGFDKNIITGPFSNPAVCAGGIDTLEGKNIYNIQGGFNQLEFTSTNILLDDDVFEYNPTLNFLSCYKYETKASPQVCVDSGLYGVAPEQKTCKPSNVGLGGGQGAPVSVTRVGVNMVGSKAIFEIDVVNSGSGKVLSPGTDIRRCGDTTAFRHTDFDRVEFNVKLVGGSSTICKPTDGVVRLVNGRGKIICTSQIDAASAFETPLKISLGYNYMDSTQKKIKIIRTPGD
jgi:hypothetical protein